MDYYKKANQTRKVILEMHNRAETSHIGSSLSCVDILTALYFAVLKITPQNVLNNGRDRFILSKGHAITALYAVLAERKFFPKDILRRYCCNGGILPGHSTRGSVPGIETSTGSLGHGLSIGAGIAFAGKADLLKYRVFVLMSDGECNEGSVWEAALFSRQYKLDNLIAIIDYNGLQGFGRNKEILDLEPLKRKWQSFGWTVQEVDGHNHEKIIKVFNKIPFRQNKPNIVIAHTIKGKGIPFMENKVEWHYKSTNNEQFKEALRHLNSL